MNIKRERQTIAPDETGNVSDVLGGEATEGAPQAAAETPAVSALKLTPDAWGRKLGHFKAGDTRLPQNVQHFDPQHAAADELFGWSRHAYHFQAAPFLITETDYIAALKTAGEFPVSAPHPAALPASQAERFANFKPRKARDKGAR
jgi:hypothetical protein